MTPRKRQPAVGKPTIVVEARRVDELLPDPANARMHGDRNVTAIRASLRQFGQQKPLVITNKNIVAAGNGTLEAAIAEGWEWIDVKVFHGTVAEARAYAIADNRSGELAHWDGDVLLQSLQSLNPQLLAATGYNTDDVEDFLERFGTAPPLDQLGGQLGDPVESALWPTLRITMPKATLDRYHALIGDVEGDSEAEQFEQLLMWAEQAKGKRRRST